MYNCPHLPQGTAGQILGRSSGQSLLGFLKVDDFPDVLQVVWFDVLVCTYTHRNQPNDIRESWITYIEGRTHVPFKAESDKLSHTTQGTYHISIPNNGVRPINGSWFAVVAISMRLAAVLYPCAILFSPNSQRKEKTEDAPPKPNLILECQQQRY